MESTIVSIQLMINTYDECAIEAAVQASKARRKLEEVIILTVRKNGVIPKIE